MSGQDLGGLLRGFLGPPTAQSAPAIQGRHIGDVCGTGGLTRAMEHPVARLQVLVLALLVVLATALAVRELRTTYVGVMLLGKCNGAILGPECAPPSVRKGIP